MRTALGTFLQSISGSLTINLADGTYTAVDSNNEMCGIFGDSGGSATILTAIIGDCATPTNVVLAVPASDNGIEIKDLGLTSISCLEFTGGNGSIGIQNAGQAAIADYNNVYWGTWGTRGGHISIADGGFVNLGATGETIVGNFLSSYHLITSGSANYFAGGPTNIPSAVSWAGGGWISSGGASGALVNLSNWSVTGAGVAGSTGPQGTFQGLGLLLTASNAKCTTVLPGSGGCTFLNGYQDLAGDVQGSGAFLNSIMPTATRNGDIVYYLAGSASWWQTIAGNTGGVQKFFFEDGSGNPGWTPLSIGMYNNNGIATRAETIDAYSTGPINSVLTAKAGYTAWNVSSTVDNLATDTLQYTCSGAPTITYYECGTSVTCASPTQIGAITLAASGRIYFNASGLSSTQISAGDFTAWGLSGTCTALQLTAKAQVHAQ
jgi:hypothetical protein